MTEFVVRLDNRPGALARLAEVLAAAGVNVEALMAWGANDEGVVRLVVDDEAGARRALSEHGLAVTEHTVLTTTVPNRPGALAEIARSLADADIAIEALYVLRTNHEHVDLALAVDEPDTAQPLIPVRGTSSIGRS
jgi:hypothetical protein